MDDQSADRRIPVEELCRGAAELIAACGPLRRMTLRCGDSAVEMEWPDVAPASRARPDAAEPAEPEGDQFAYITAGTVGTFYIAPEPGAKPFVREGDLVHIGQQVAIVEAMKLMTPVEADKAGQVVRIMITDGAPVEYGTPLIALTHSPASR